MVLVDSNFLFHFHFITHRLRWEKRDDKTEVEQKIAVNKYHQFAEICFKSLYRVFVYS